MLLPVLKNFILTPGSGFDYRFQYNEGEPNSSVPVNLTTMSGQLVLNNGQGGAYLTLNSEASVGVTGLVFGAPNNTPTNGVIDIVIDAGDSSAQAWKYAGYNLYLSTSSLSPSPILPGQALPSGAFQVMYGTFSMISFSVA